MLQSRRKVATPATAKRSRLEPEAVEMRFQIGDSRRQRLFGVIRLSLGGAIFGAALGGVGGRLFGFEQTPELLGALIGAATVAVFISTHLEPPSNAN